MKNTPSKILGGDLSVYEESTAQIWHYTEGDSRLTIVVRRPDKIQEYFHIPVCTYLQAPMA